MAPTPIDKLQEFMAADVAKQYSGELVQIFKEVFRAISTLRETNEAKYQEALASLSNFEAGFRAKLGATNADVGNKASKQEVKALTSALLSFKDEVLDMLEDVRGEIPEVKELTGEDIIERVSLIKRDWLPVEVIKGREQFVSKGQLETAIVEIGGKLTVLEKRNAKGYGALGGGSEGTGSLFLSRLRDVDLTGLSIVNGKYVLGSGSTSFTLTTTGTSGAATYSGGVLNIPIYSGGSTDDFWDRDTGNGYLYPQTITDMVGIGTATPDASLHVSGTGAVPIIFERTTASSNVAAEFRNNSGSWFAGQGSGGSFNLRYNLSDLGGANTPFTFTQGGNVGIATIAPTHSLTLGSTATGIVLYNTASQSTDYERGIIQWSSNILLIAAQASGTGTSRSMNLNAGSNLMSLSSSGVSLSRAATAITSLFTVTTSSTGLSSGSVTQSAITLNPTVTQTGSASYTMLLINPTESSVGSGAKLLIDAQVGGVSKFSVDNNGLTSAGNLNVTSTSIPTNGFYLPSANSIGISTAGSLRFIFNNTGLIGATNGALVLANNASSTTPTLVPNRSSANTGFGAQASGNISAIVAGAEVGRFTSTGLNNVDIGSTTPGDGAFTTLTVGTLTGILKGTSGLVSAAVAGTDYQAPLTLTTTGTSGAATLIGSTLNIPNYSSGSGGITRTIVVTSGNVTAGSTASTDYVYLVAGAHTVTLPTAVSNTNLYTVKNNHSVNITVDTTSSQTIDGTLTISIPPGAAVGLISTNSAWSIV